MSNSCITEADEPSVESSQQTASTPEADEK